ncbi:hypothetical protein HELRODRAFT_166227 [Helobdella robusta]|uniref:Uncharacterized protein n=1 Tax=Helobdella robusta TaxID=6412 RepID=T1EXX1_HELRO|nr:hypothetical protein HELRODRAFT_166227 [Helobdella robusta]ESN90547.1 hypothetical protein HELRODRAFT_166227 [Helobdella robusta]
MNKNDEIKRLIDVKMYLYKRSAEKISPNDLMTSFKKVHQGPLVMGNYRSEIKRHKDKETIISQLTNEEKDSQDENISEHKISFEIPSVEKTASNAIPVRYVKVSWKNTNIEINVKGGEQPFLFIYRTQPMFYCHPEYNVGVFCDITYLDPTPKPSILKRIGDCLHKLANINLFRSDEKKKIF